MSESTATANEGSCGCESVCALPADAIGPRKEKVRVDFLPYVLGHETSADKVIWRLEGSDEIRSKLEEFVAFERECCSGLDFHIDGQSDASELILTVSGAGAEIFSADQSGDSVPTHVPVTAATVAKAGGIGLGISLALCCLLPLAIAGLGGAALVAPMAKLDNPLVIGAGSFLFAIPVWWRMRRNSGDVCGPEC